MLVVSLQVAASKCCHAVAVPAGGPEPAAGPDTPDPNQARALLLAESARTRAADRSADPDRPRPRGLVAACDSLRLAHRGDEERTDTRNTSGTYRSGSRGEGWRSDPLLRISTRLPDSGQSWRTFGGLGLDRKWCA